MRALASWCFRRKFVVLAIWIVALVTLGGLSASVGSGYTDSFSLPGTESTTALNLLTDNFSTESKDTNKLVLASVPRSVGFGRVSGRSGRLGVGCGRCGPGWRVWMRELGRFGPSRSAG